MHYFYFYIIEITLNLAASSSLLLYLLHRRQMRGSLTVSTGNRPTGKSSTCPGKQHPSLSWKTSSLYGAILFGVKSLKDAHGYVKVLSIIAVHFIQSFCQCGVNNQLATGPVLRRRLSLSTLFVAFHHIRQNLQIKQNKQRVASFVPL